MTARQRPAIGLLGRLLAILLAMTAIEFVAGTILYERSAGTLVRDDEAHRLAEHLVIARTLIAERPWAERPAMAERLTTSRYDVHWSGAAASLPAQDPRLEAMRATVVNWEPALAQSDLRLTLATVGPASRLFGALRLPDGTWVRFRAAAPGETGLAARSILLALLPVTVLLAVGALLFRRALGPLGPLARAADRIGHGSAVALPPETGPREVRRLVRAFAAMQARIHQLIADRTEALAAVGHDLRTPLARLRLRVDAIADPDRAREIHDDLGEMEAMVGSLLAYLGGESDPESPVRADVAVLAATIVDDATDRGAEATYAGPGHLEADVRAIGLKRALANLVENAIHYGGRADVHLAATDTELVFAVEDGGPGIPEAEIADALRAFSRLDRARARNTKGLGLGLAIVQRLATQEGGTLTLANRAAGGLRAEIRIPRR